MKLEQMFPSWSDLVVHESSPGGVSSAYIARKVLKYIGSHYFVDTKYGDFKQGFRCENLEDQTFDDESFDLVVTQDVMEHVLNPSKAFAEIARTLKPGGVHVFTVPVYKGRTTKVRARAGSSGIEYLEQPDFHGNPIDENGSLVVTEWGPDIVDFVLRSSGLETTIYSFADKRFGLDGEFLDVLVSRKHAGPSPSDQLG